MADAWLYNYSMSNEMDSSEYIEWLKTFRFSDDQRKWLLDIPRRNKEEVRQKLELALPKIEEEIRTYRFDLRTFKKLRPKALTDFKHFCSEAKTVQYSIKVILKDYQYLNPFHVQASWLGKLSADLENYISLIEASADLIAPDRTKRGRPENTNLHVLALNVGRNLLESGLPLSKNRKGLFCKLYRQICIILKVEKVADPIEHTQKAILALEDNLANKNKV